jgi:uncharacterized protein YdhG (YjbR/CyaY superfamily)
MAEQTTAKKPTAKTTTAKTTSGRDSTSKTGGFTADERAAMRERAKELKAEARRGKDREAGEADLLAKIAEMPQPDRGLAERLHAIVMETAPDLMPKTWYGMPAWAKDGKILCFFQPAAKFDARYASFGFNDTATLDAGVVWPTSWAVTALPPAEEKKIAALVKKAARG